jgi:hypothetical protein
MVESKAKDKNPSKKPKKESPAIRVNPNQYDHPIGPEKAEV